MRPHKRLRTAAIGMRSREIALRRGMAVTRSARLLTLAAAAGLLSLPGLTQATARDLPTTDPSTAGLSSDGLDRMNAAIVKAATDRKIPGGVLLIARHGRVAHLSTFGFADRDAR